jgi:hypothetical protein
MPKFGTLPIAQGGTGATTKADAFNNIVAQGGTFTGGVTFKGHPLLSNSSYYGSLWFNPTMITSDASIARIYAYAAGASDTAITRSQMIIRQYSYTSGTTNILSSYYDDFKLPLTAADKTKTNSYDILTSKNPVTVGQGGTGATSADAACENLGALRIIKWANGYTAFTDASELVLVYKVGDTDVNVMRLNTDYTSFSKSGLIEQLEYEGFTDDQIAYAISKVGY